MKLITAKDLRPMDDPGNGWYMIEANGEHPHDLDDGVTIIQVLDNDAMEQLIDSYVPGSVFLDKDHLSRKEDNDTAAKAWLNDLAGLDDGGKIHLCGLLEWTPPGLELARNKEYKKFSTEYDVATLENLGDGRFRPRLLVGLALTNRENNPGQRPITNRKCDPITNTQPTQTPITMEELKQIATLLGLSEEATLEDILAAIKTMQDETSAAQEAEADAILSSEGADDMSPEEKELMKEQLITNRARAMKVLANRKAKRATSVANLPPRIHNRATAANRQMPLGNSRDEERRKAQDEVNRAMEICRTTGCDYFRALRLARMGQ